MQLTHSLIVLFSFLMKLSKTESAVLHSLAAGKRYDAIITQYKITPENLHSVCWRIRRKTGIPDTKDHAQCRAYVRGVNPASLHVYKSPTWEQIKVMKLYAQGMTLAKLAEHLQKALQTVANYLSQGCKRAGIDAPAPIKRQAIRDYFAKIGDPLGLVTRDDPMDEF